MVVIAIISMMSGCSNNSYSENPGNQVENGESEQLNNQTEDENGDFSHSEDYHIPEVPDGYIGIYDAEDLQNISKNLSANYILMNDLYMEGAVFTPFEGVFEGRFLGNNYTIYDFSSYASLFPRVSGAYIEAISFENADLDLIRYAEDYYIDEELAVGGIVGEVIFNGNCTEISNCSFNGEIRMYGGSDHDEDYTYGEIGGIIGRLAGSGSSVYDCSFNGTIEIREGYKYCIGGIAGNSWAESNAIMRCSSSGEILSNDKVMHIGGIVGIGSCDVANCYSTINIDVNNCDGIGGIVGFLESGRTEMVYYAGEIKYNQLFSSKPSYWGTTVEPDSNRSAGNIVGILGTEGVSIQYCYFEENEYDAVGEGVPFPNVCALSESEMKNQEAYHGFDFERCWEMGKSDYEYPIFNDMLINY